jgi:tRNA(Ile)-lysidine synthase
MCESLSPTARVAVAVSGGRDSMVLLDLLRRQLSAERIVVLHFNHNLRRESDDEQQFIAEYCKRHTLSFLCEQGRDLLDSAGLSLEMAARDARYNFFRCALREHNIAALYLGHHADDQAETVVMRLLAGTGIQGMGAITSQREFSPGVALLRPLLSVTRSEIDAYVHRFQIPYCEDTSNSDERILRNRIRHSLIPSLQSFNAGCVEHLCSVAEEAQYLYEWIEPLLKEYRARVIEEGAIVREAYREMPLWPRRELLRHFLIEHGCSRPTRERIIAFDAFIIDAHHTGLFQVGEGVSFECFQKRVSYYSGVEAHRESHYSLAGVSLPQQWCDDYFSWRVEECDFLWDEREAGKSECFLDINCMEKLTVRTRQQGDYISLYNRATGECRHKKLQRFFMDAKIDRDRRDLLPLVSCDKRVVIIPGYFRDAGMRPRYGESVLRIAWTPLHERDSVESD